TLICVLVACRVTLNVYALWLACVLWWVPFSVISGRRMIWCGRSSGPTGARTSTFCRARAAFFRSSRFGRGRACMAPLRSTAILLAQLVQRGRRQDEPLFLQHRVGVKLRHRRQFDPTNVAGRFIQFRIQTGGTDQKRRVLELPLLQMLDPLLGPLFLTWNRR